MTPTRYELVIEAARDPYGREPVIRLRQVLKLMLRGFGFKCISAVETKPATEAGGQRVPPATSVLNTPLGETTHPN